MNYYTAQTFKSGKAQVLDGPWSNSVDAYEAAAHAYAVTPGAAIAPGVIYAPEGLKPGDWVAKGQVRILLRAEMA